MHWGFTIKILIKYKGNSNKSTLKWLQASSQSWDLYFYANSP